MASVPTYKGHCFCGAVELTVSGEPVAMGYCHCNSCRSWSAGPVYAFALWPPDAVRITKGADYVGTFTLTSGRSRKWCRNCGGHLLTEHPGTGLTDVYAAAIPSLSFRTALHVLHPEIVTPTNDGLPGFRELQKESAGSGETITE